MTQSSRTPGRRSPSTIAEATKKARSQLQPFARRYGIPIGAMLMWTGSAQRVVLSELAPLASQYGVKPKTLIKWATS